MRSLTSNADINDRAFGKGWHGTRPSEYGSAPYARPRRNLTAYNFLN